MTLRKPAKTRRNTVSRISKARLAAMIEEATADAYGAQRGSFCPDSERCSAVSTGSGVAAGAGSSTR